MDKKQLAEKISSLIKDPNFVVKLSETKSDEEAVKLFTDNGCPLAADKVKLVRDTLNSLIKGDIELSEEDLENISGGKIDTTKVLVVALAATLVIGGTAWAVSSSQATPPPQPQGSRLREAATDALVGAGKAAARVGTAYAGVMVQPTWYERAAGVFSRSQRARNAAWDAAAEGIAGTMQ